MKHNFYMVKYSMHIIDNVFGDEYDKEAYFLDHDEAAEYIAWEESEGNVVIITGDFKWVHADKVPYNLNTEFKDVKKEEERFWERYYEGELGVIPELDKLLK